MNPNNLGQIYSILMSNIKQFSCKEPIGEKYAIIEKYTKENMQKYEEKVV